MTRFLYVQFVALAALLVIGQSALAGTHKHQTKKFDAYAVVDSATLVDNAPDGDSQGDVITFTQKLYSNSSMTRQIGTDQVYCVRTIAGSARVCTGIFHIKGGQITFTGPESLERHALAITGGTGKWRTARGEVILVPDSVVADRMSFRVKL